MAFCGCGSHKNENEKRDTVLTPQLGRALNNEACASSSLSVARDCYLPQKASGGLAFWEDDIVFSPDKASHTMG